MTYSYPALHRFTQALIPTAELLLTTSIEWASRHRHCCGTSGSPGWWKRAGSSGQYSWWIGSLYQEFDIWKIGSYSHAVAQPASQPVPDIQLCILFFFFPFFSLSFSNMTLNIPEPLAARIHNTSPFILFLAFPSSVHRACPSVSRGDMSVTKHPTAWWLYPGKSV